MRKPTKQAKRSRFVYKERPPEATKARAEQTGGRFDSPIKPNVDTFRPKEGSNLIRILPPTWDGFEHYGLDVWLHKRIGPDNSTYLCLRKMQNKNCPICTAAKEAETAGESDEARAMAPQKAVVMWVLDRDASDPKPMIYIQSWAQDRDVASLVRNPRTGKVLAIDHPDEGYDLSINRRGRGIQTRYTFAVDRDPTPIHDDQDVQDQILEFIEDNPVPEQMHYYPADYLEKLLTGTNEERDEDLDEVETKTTTRRTRSRDPEDEVEEETEERETRRTTRRTSRRDEPEPEEEDETEAEPEDEPEERPRRSRRSEPEEDEVEEEKPRRSRSVARDEEEEEPDERPRRRARPEPEEEEPEERPRRARREPEPEPEEDEPEEERPRRRTTRREEPEERPARSRRAEPEDEEEDERPQRRRVGRR